MLLFGAAGVFGQLKDALNTIWEIEPKKEGGFLGMIKARFFSVLMVMGVGFLLLVTLVFDAVISAMGDYAGGRLPGGEGLIQTLQLIISFGLVTVVFAMIFRYVPDIRVPWRDVWFGAVVTAILFVLGKFGLGLYLGKAAVGSAYGAAGSLVILLVWVYWSAQIVFFGAEFTQVYARSHGTMKNEVRPAAQPYGAPADAGVRAQPARVVVQRGGGKGKLVVGGVAGMFVGVLLAGITAAIVAIKSVKKLILIPFK
jgi:membrane protein